MEVDFDGVPAWILREAQDRVFSPPSPRGVRLLVAPDLRLFGRDRDGRFIAPGLRPLTPAADTFHPNGVLVDGRIVGAWGREGGHVDVVLAEHLTRDEYHALADEVATMPLANPNLAIRTSDRSTSAES